MSSIVSYCLFVYFPFFRCMSRIVWEKVYLFPSYIIFLLFHWNSRFKCHTSSRTLVLPHSHFLYLIGMNFLHDILYGCSTALACFHFAVGYLISEGVTWLRTIQSCLYIHIILAFSSVVPVHLRFHPTNCIYVTNFLLLLSGWKEQINWYHSDS